MVRVLCGGGVRPPTTARKPAGAKPAWPAGFKRPAQTPFAGQTSRPSADGASSPEEYALLRQRIDAILRSAECRAMNFTIGPYLVTGNGYTTVAGAIAAGTITLAIAEAAGYEASYTPATRTFTLPRVDYGTRRTERAAIVHEATHAMIDIYWGMNSDNGSSLAAPVEEPIAYIAQSVFRELSERAGSSSTGPAVSHPTGEIERQATLIGARIALELIHTKNRLLTPMPRVEQHELSLLARAISVHPEYQ